MDDFILLENLSGTHNCALYCRWYLSQLETPCCNRLGLLEIVKHLLNTLHALLRGELFLHESVSHAWSLSDVVRNTVYNRELWRQVKKVV